jgi:hypothetical protein
MLLRRAKDERVRILVPRVATFDAIVARVVPGAAEFALVAEPPVAPRFLHRRRAIVLPPRGDDRLDGMLLAVPGSHGRVRDDMLHFLEEVLPITRRPEPQRRDFARVDVALPVTMVPNGFRVGWLNGFARNMSANGLLVAGAGALELGDKLRVRLELQDEHLIDLLARVVRADDWGLRGLRLEDLDEHVRDQLVRYVFERQRRALAELRARAG